MTCSKFCAKFKSNLGLSGVSEVYFWKSEWETFEPCDRRSTISNLFLFYRLIYAVFFVVTLFFVLIWTPNQRLGYWPIYLTNWSYSLQTIYALVAFYHLVAAKWDSLQPPVWGAGQDEFIGCTPRSTLPALTKLTWVLFNATTMISTGVTIIYWVAIYDGEPAVGIIEIVSNYSLHVMNSVLAIADTMIVAIPVRVTQFVYGYSILFVYLIFTILYEVAGGTYENGTNYIYKVLNWKDNPSGAAVTCALATLVFILCHTIFVWSLSRCRIYVANKLASGYTAL